MEHAIAAAAAAAYAGASYAAKHGRSSGVTTSLMHARLLSLRGTVLQVYNHVH
jgi:hypothetical protein